MPRYDVYTAENYVGTYTADQLAEVIAELTQGGAVTLTVIPVD